jgi:hypothetical protein
MRITLLVTVAALGMTLAAPAFADSADPPEILTSAAGATAGQIADGGDYLASNLA